MIKRPKVSTSSVLASFATLKSLSDENKYQSPYQILREFIRYIILTDSLYSFSAIEIKCRLMEYFEFSIPEAVIKTSLKNMAGVSLDHGTYNVVLSEIGTDSMFEVKKREADKSESNIIKMLYEYIADRTNDSVSEETVTDELIGFLYEGAYIHSPNKYMDLIGEFILQNEHNTELREELNKIRQGSILYMGLSHNICETGSITRPLTMYLGTEILFSLAGYNGEIYQEFANDFYEQVRVANSSSSKKITLHFFCETKKEVDDFFGTACDIVDGKKPRLLDKPAMKAITDGCTTSSDVEVRKSDFYYNLKHHYGITEDPHDNYYDEGYFSTNLESFDYEDEDDKKRKRETAIKLISHINKLRNGNRYSNDIDSGYIIITNTKVILLISKEQADIIKEKEGIDNVCNFAVSLDRITSLLWYKLGKGFAGKSFPSSVDAALKARIVLSSSIAKNAEKAFTELKKQYEDGTITEDQVAARIIALRNKPRLPEDLQGDDIAEIMDFSPEYLSRYEEQFKNAQKALKEKDELVETIRADATKRIAEMDATIASQGSAIKEKDDENAKLRETIEAYKRRDDVVAKKKESRKMKRKFRLSIAFRLLLIAFITGIIIALKRLFSFDIPTYVYAVIDALAVVVAFRDDIKALKQKYLMKGTKETRGKQ